MDHVSVLFALVESWGPPLLFGAAACLLLAAAALPFMSLAAFASAMRTKRGLYDRCARQLGRLARILPALLAGCLILAYVGAHAGWPPLADWFWQTALRVDAVIACVGALIAAAVLWGVCAGAWQRLRAHPAALWLIGLAGGLCAAFVPALCLMIVCLPTAGIDLAAFSGWRDPLLPARLAEVGSGSVFLYSLALLVLLGAAAGGGIALIWLILRRARDDYGRDYYAFAARWCGKWAAAGGWFSLAALASILWVVTEGAFFSALGVHGLHELHGGPHAPALIAAGLLAVASVLWTAVARSAAPMRHKPGMVLALLCFLAGLAAGFPLLPL